MDHISYETALLWVFLLPLAGALINGLFGRTADRQLVGGIAVGTVAGAFALAVLCAVRVFMLKSEGTAENISVEVYDWISVGPMPISVRFVLEALSHAKARGAKMWESTCSSSLVGIPPARRDLAHIHIAAAKTMSTSTA